MKGLSFNVTLSNEQIEEIASRTADKVTYTKNILHNNEQYYKSENERLQKQITDRDRIITLKELERDRMLKIIGRHKKTINKYKEKYGEVE